ncbi:MAG TPA: PAS domain S-box protein, partial [Opitutaceae bacterium]|nr:PAS domain S-box protein [Opitutaceae bacterium]
MSDHCHSSSGIHCKSGDGEPTHEIERLTKENACLGNELRLLQRMWIDIQEVMSASSVAIVILDRELKIVRHTSSAVKLFNLLPSDLGRPLADLTHRMDYETILEDAQRVLVTLSPHAREVKGPDECWLLARLTAHTNSADQTAAVALTFIDITERRKMEEDRRSSESRIRGTITQNATGILISDLSGKVSFVNRKLCELLDSTEVDLLNLPYWEVLQEDSQLHPKLFERVNEAASPLQIEKRLKRKDGSVFWANVSISLVHDHEGDPLSIVAVFIETTDRKLTEEALRASRQRLHAIFSEAAVGLSELSTEGRFLRVNDRICEILGRSRQELLQLSAPAVTHSDDLPATLNALQAVLATGKPHSVEKRYVRPDGSLIWANSAISRLDDDDGKARAILVVTADINEQKNAESQLRRAGEELERHVIARTHQLNDANRELRQQIAERLAAEQARQQIARQLVTAQERERSRISRELHDEVGQHLTGLMLG